MPRKNEEFEGIGEFASRIHYSHRLNLSLQSGSTDWESIHNSFGRLSV